MGGIFDPDKELPIGITRAHILESRIQSLRDELLSSNSALRLRIGELSKQELRTLNAYRQYLLRMLDR